MERLKKNLLFRKPHTLFFSSTLYYPSFWQMSSPKLRSCRLSKAEEKMVTWATVLMQILNSMGLFCILPLLNVEGIIHWMVLSILLVYTAFIPYSSMQNACSFSHSCLILHPVSSMSMCTLPSHQSSLSSSPRGYQVFRPYLAETPVNSQILLFSAEISCPWPEPAVS